MTRAILLLSVFSLIALGILYKAGVDVVDSLSPQGCRMSYMLPSYLLQTSFDDKWTRLSNRYSLWLYREAGWETHEVRISSMDAF